MKKVLKSKVKSKVKSKATLDFILASMPNVTDEMFFNKFDVSADMAIAFLAKKSVTFLN